MQPERTMLDGSWAFSTDPEDRGTAERWFAEDHDRSGWRSVPVPGNWEHFGVPDYDGAAWYHRTFSAPPKPAERKRGLVIRGVDDSAIVWINGREAARQPEYNRAFAFDLEPFLREGDNEIAIRVFDTGGPGGVIGSVFIEPFAELRQLYRGEYADTRARASADWVRDAVIYEVYLRSFSPEGTFAGLSRGLDELADLGVTVIWLMPIHPVGVKNRKGPLGSPYSISDYYGVNPEFGTLEDFKSLLGAAHARGMKLIIDLVANHTAWDCDLIDRHGDWYAKDARGEIVPPNPDWSDVAQLDYGEAELRAYMRDMMLYWVRDVGIDGFRCDVAGMVPNDFWTEVRPQLDAVRPVMMLAEDDQPLQHVAAFDLTYDWRTYDHLERLQGGKLTADDVMNVLADEELRFPRGSLRLRFSSNHDKNAWVAPAPQRYGPGGTRLAAALTFALPGVPLIYNGQEVGNRTQLGLFDKTEIDWSREALGLRELYRTLARLRREQAGLRTDECERVETGDAHVLAVRRGDVTIVLNLKPSAARVAVDTPNTALLHIEPDCRVRAGASGTTGRELELAPHGFAFLGRR